MRIKNIFISYLFYEMIKLGNNHSFNSKNKKKIFYKR